jgi:Glycosyl-4,4'-diaponeurosporenoate acyltransferase
MMAKKIVFVFISTVFMAWSYFLITIILSTNPAKYNLILTILNSWAATACITGIFAFTGFVFPTHKLFGTRVYKIYNPRLLTFIYKLLGVSLFRKGLLFFFWGAKKNRTKYFNGTRGGLENFIYQSKQSEFGHLGSLLVIIPVSILFWSRGYVLFALITTIFNIIGNLYPILLQRYHRIRIERILSTV